MTAHGAVGRKLRREGWTGTGQLTSANPVLLLHRLWLDDSDKQLSAIRKASMNIPDELLRAVAMRRFAATAALTQPSRHVAISPMWRLVVGHGEDSALESGLTMSSTYGVPMLPGSALKGACAAQAGRDGWPLADVIRVFGGPRPGTRTSSAQQGSVVFWDALPQVRPQVVVDVLTPHVMPYYEDANAGRPITHAPAEYHNPIPVRFLAVERTSFHGILTGPPADVEAAATLLRVAADEWGLGGKTAAGYGYCEVTEMTAQEIIR